MLRTALILFVMVLLFGGGVIFTAPPPGGRPDDALAKTRAEINMAGQAVSSYAQGHRHVPNDAEGLKLLTEKTANGSAPSYLKEVPMDSWGHPLIYKLLDARTQKFMIYSAGPDGIDNGGAGDDVIAGMKNYQCGLYGSCLTAKDYVYQAFVIAALLTLLASIGVAIYSIKNMGKARPPAP